MQHFVILRGMNQRTQKKRVCRVWCSTTRPKFYHLKLHGLSLAIANKITSFKGFEAPQALQLQINCFPWFGYYIHLLFTKVCWKKSNFPTFLSPSPRNAIFCSELWKAQLFRQRSFPQETENDLRISENCLSQLDATKKYFIANSFHAHPNNCIKLRKELWCVHYLSRYRSLEERPLRKTWCFSVRWS